jgi:hypothetical protein
MKKHAHILGRRDEPDLMYPVVSKVSRNKSQGILTSCADGVGLRAKPRRGGGVGMRGRGPPVRSHCSCASARFSRAKKSASSRRTCASIPSSSSSSPLSYTSEYQSYASTECWNAYVLSESVSSCAWSSMYCDHEGVPSALSLASSSTGNRR